MCDTIHAEGSVEQSEICEQIKQHLRNHGIKPIEDARIVVSNGTLHEFVVRFDSNGKDFHIEPVGVGVVPTIILEIHGKTIKTVQSGRIELCTSV